MGDRRHPTQPPTDQRRPDPPPAPPPRHSDHVSGHVLDELRTAHETLDRFGVARTGTAAWSRHGRAETFALSLRQRIEELHRLRT